MYHREHKLEEQPQEVNRAALLHFLLDRLVFVFLNKAVHNDVLLQHSKSVSLNTVILRLQKDRETRIVQQIRTTQKDKCNNVEVDEKLDNTGGGNLYFS